MPRPAFPTLLAVLAVAVTLMPRAELQAQRPDSATARSQPATTARKGYVEADVHFMQGMIAHHAQAVVMAAMVPTHEASDRIQLFARKIDLSQRDEMRMMKQWLEDRKEPVPATDDHSMMHMPGMDMPAAQMPAAHMPGMLTAEQLAQLDAARGAEFDRLFLTFMIQHHEGALQMIQVLFDAPRGGQEPDLFRLVSDVAADQRAEIERMQQMLDAAPTTRRPTL